MIKQYEILINNKWYPIKGTEKDFKTIIQNIDDTGIIDDIREVK